MKAKKGKSYLKKSTPYNTIKYNNLVVFVGNIFKNNINFEHSFLFSLNRMPCY